MIKLVWRVVAIFVINLVGLAAAAYFVNGFSITPDPIVYIKLAAVFTALNIVIRPILKLLLSPLILITLGLGVIVVNAIMLWLLYKVYPLGLSITGLYPLVYATLIISAVHLALGFVTKRS